MSLLVTSTALISNVCLSIPRWTLRQTRRFAPPCLRLRRANSPPDCLLTLLSPLAFALDLDPGAVDQEMQRTLRPTMQDVHRKGLLADRVAVILDGQVRQYDRADQFYKRPASQDVARFFGGQNFQHGTAQGLVFKSALGPLILTEGTMQGPGTLTIRPEAIRIGPATFNTLTALVTDCTYLGTQTRLKLRAGDADLAAVLGPDLAEGIAPGQVIQINLPPQNLWVMP